MRKEKARNNENTTTICQKAILMLLVVLLLCPFNLFSNSFAFAAADNDNAKVMPTEPASDEPEEDETADGTATATADGTATGSHHKSVTADRAKFIPTDTIDIAPAPLLPDSVTEITDEWVPREIEFNPDPTKAVWLAALFPGLGQVYNRRYWKLPLIVGGYLGLGYATSWNNGMLTDYTKAYADIMDNDPTTRSYMDFFPSTVKEEDLDKTWLTNILRSRKNYFRRNRDLCIIGMVAVYLVAIVDAYVDAQLAHFDISPDLSMDVYPSLIQDGRSRMPSMGLQWAITF